MADYHRPDPPAVAPGPGPSLADHARAWDVPPEDPGFGIDQAINRARAVGRVRRTDDDRDRAGRPDREAARAAVAAWNAAHPVGQAVVVTCPDETSYRGRTTSPAGVMGGSPVIAVEVRGRPLNFWPLSWVEAAAELPDAPTAAAEAERPGVLPVAPEPETEPEPETGPDALAVLCRELGTEFVALADARRDGAGWDAGHWRRLRGAVEAAGIALDAGPRPVQGGEQP